MYIEAAGDCMESNVKELEIGRILSRLPLSALDDILSISLKTPSTPLMTGLWSEGSIVGTLKIACAFAVNVAAAFSSSSALKTALPVVEVMPVVELPLPAALPPPRPPRPLPPMLPRPPAPPRNVSTLVKAVEFNVCILAFRISSTCCFSSVNRKSPVK